MSLRQRPENFTLDYSHPLAQGLVFAGLRNAPGVRRYYDSSMNQNHGYISYSSSTKNAKWDIDTFSKTQCVRILDYGEQNPFIWFSKPLNGYFSFSVVVKIIKETIDNYGRIITNSRQAAYQSNQDWSIQQNNDDTFSFSVNSVTTALTGVKSISSFANGYNTIIGVYDNNKISLYVNNKLENSTNKSGYITSNETLFRIGGYSNLYINCWHGKILDSMVYNRALSIGEINAVSDRSNIMYSGLVQSPKRKLYAIRSTIYSKRYFRISKIITRY